MAIRFCVTFLIYTLIPSYVSQRLLIVKRNPFSTTIVSEERAIAPTLLLHLVIELALLEVPPATLTTILARLNGT